MRVYYAAKGLANGHGQRGIGFYNKNLLLNLQKECKKAGITILSGEQDHDYEVIHYPYFDLFKNTLKPDLKAKTVVTIYDVISLLYPKHYPSGIHGWWNLELQKLALKRVDVVVTISETSKKDIVRYLGVPENKIKVIYSGGNYLKTGLSSEKDKHEVIKKYNLPSEYVLYVGDVNYNKNIINLARACTIAKLPLVIVGKHASELEEAVESSNVVNRGYCDRLRTMMGQVHPEIAHYKELITAFENSKDIYRLGFVSDEDISVIFSNAKVYCQPSLYEGFGMPVLEAFSFGIPVVCAKTQALVEIAGDAAVFVNPNDPVDIARGLDKVMGDIKLRKQLIVAGKSRLSLFNWEDTSRRLVTVYQNLLNEK